MKRIVSLDLRAKGDSFYSKVIFQTIQIDYLQINGKWRRDISDFLEIDSGQDVSYGVNSAIKFENFISKVKHS